jgi:hypothetical protein
LPVYGGLSVEYGDTFQSRSEIGFEDAIASALCS